MLFFRNCPPCDVVVIPDDEGYVYIYKVTESNIEFFDMLKGNSSKKSKLFKLKLLDCSDIVTAHGCIILASTDGKLNIFSLQDPDNITCSYEITQ